MCYLPILRDDCVPEDIDFFVAIFQAVGLLLHPWST